MAKKLFGNTSSAKFASGKKPAKEPKKAKKKKGRLRPLKVVLSILLVLETLYCVAIFSSIPFIVRLRNMYIETAMSTMTCRWLATSLIPKDIVDEVMQRVQDARDAQMGVTSSWTDSTEATEHDFAVTEPSTAPTEDALTPEQEAFFQLFWELDQSSMLGYVKQHPDVASQGWDKIKINEAGLDDNGTSIRTTMGEQVLAIDAENELLLVRVTGGSYPGYRGVLAIAKDPSRLGVFTAKSIGSYGEHAGDIAQRNNGLLAITGSGFEDPDGGGNGGALAGDCLAAGEAYYGRVPYGWGYKRIELWDDNRLYIMDATDRFSERATDAVEFWPALVVDGENALRSDNIFTEMNPRACLGQSKDEEILMLVIEGRSLTSVGTDAMECVDILLRHNCYQAMNLDGGTSAIMWYDGEYIIRCSNSNLDEGRYLPNAWVYTAEPIED